VTLHDGFEDARAATCIAGIVTDRKDIGSAQRLVVIIWSLRVSVLLPSLRSTLLIDIRFSERKEESVVDVKTD